MAHRYTNGVTSFFAAKGDIFIIQPFPILVVMINIALNAFRHLILRFFLKTMCPDTNNDVFYAVGVTRGLPP